MNHPTLADQRGAGLLQTIHALRQARINGGGDDVAADLHGLRIQLLKQRERVVRGWKVCARCGVERSAPLTPTRVHGGASA